MRAYKTVNDAYIEPVSFTVPRRAETFQSDIFPPAIGLKPAVSAKDWLDGKTGVPSKIDLESIYDGSAPKEVPSDYKPPSPIPAPVAKPAPKQEPKEEPKPAVRSPPPTMTEQKGSISAMANKFQDNEEEEEEDDDDETSSFEEVARPAQRTTMPVRSEPKPVPAVKTQPAPAPVRASSPVKSPTLSSTSTPRGTAAPSSVGDSSLDQIKELIENQTKMIMAQNDKIGSLAGEVESLKKKVGTGSQDQSERIRQLELELEEARS